MTGQLQGKVAIVTGAGAVGPGWGNGKASAVLFAREGARVVAVDNNQAAAEETVAIIRKESGEAHVHVADVSDPESVASMAAAAHARWGQIDVLLNNVGILESGGPIETSTESWDRVMAVNVRSVFLTCKHLLPHMVAQGSGAIVNVSSISASRWAGASYISYPTSKGAIESFTRHIAAQYGPCGIRCNAVVPGLMKTPMAEKMVGDALAANDAFSIERANKIPLRCFGDAWDVAHAALYLASDAAKYVTGVALVVDGGISVQMGL